MKKRYVTRQFYRRGLLGWIVWDKKEDEPCWGTFNWERKPCLEIAKEWNEEEGNE
jgi:hypothetical protein